MTGTPSARDSRICGPAAGASRRFQRPAIRSRSPWKTCSNARWCLRCSWCSVTETPSVVLVSREVYPFTGGGIAPMVTATATLLAEIADVTIVTTSAHQEAYDELCANPDGALR